MGSSEIKTKAGGTVGKKMFASKSGLYASIFGGVFTRHRWGSVEPGIMEV